MQAEQTYQNTTPTVFVEGGDLQGTCLGDVSRYLGIPYAAPPVGPLRWRAPQPVVPWDGVREAVSYGNDCYQNEPTYDRLRSREPKSEDCLYLNVWAPANSKDGPLPVMVWIHGGALVQGAASSASMDGSALARKGVIVVSFNYRLGRFGFFAHPALMGEPDWETGNFGILDQIAALKWVANNITQFGGDPSNVTLFGESAGGASISTLLVNDAGRGLFHKAIIQSSGGRQPMPHMADWRAGERPAVARGIAQAKKLGFDVPTADQLRDIAADKLTGRLSLIAMQRGHYSGPMIDDHIVRMDPTTYFSVGGEVDVPLIAGFTDGEFGNIPFVSQISRQVLKELPGENNRIKNLYKSRRDFADNFLTELEFGALALRTVRAASSPSVYLYRFSHVPHHRKRKDKAGAPHASDVPYVFGTVGQISPEADEYDLAQADMISGMWAQFAKTGNPNGSGRHQWSPYGHAQTLFEFSGGAGDMRPVPHVKRLELLGMMAPNTADLLVER